MIQYLITIFDFTSQFPVSGTILEIYLYFYFWHLAGLFIACLLETIDEDYREGWKIEIIFRGFWGIFLSCGLELGCELGVYFWK